MTRVRKQSEHPSLPGVPATLSVVKFTPYHFRVADVLDLHPTNYRFHNLRTGKRGSYFGKSKEQMAKFIESQIAEAGPAKPSRRMSFLAGRCVFCPNKTESFFMCDSCREKNYFQLIGMPSAKEAN